MKTVVETTLGLLTSGRQFRSCLLVPIQEYVIDHIVVQRASTLAELGQLDREDPHPCVANILEP